MTTQELLSRLETDIEEDAKKMGRWRQIHRVIGTAVTLILIVLPVSTAMKLLGEGAIQTYGLFALTVLAAFDGMFKPAAYSARRRVDATDMTELLWQFRSAVVAAGTEQGRQLAVHDAYRKRYLDLYRQRGQYLVDYGLAQRENDKRKSDTAAPEVAGGSPPAPASGAGAAPAAGAPAAGAPAAGAPAAGAPAAGAPAAGAPAAGAPKTGAATNGDITTGPP
jgi:hypothetical protein